MEAESIQQDQRFSMDEENIADLTSVIAEFPNGDDDPKKLPIKKLQRTFDDMAKTGTDPTKSSGDDSGMKVYIRIKPSSKPAEMTMTVLNETSIMASAPEESKRALYTKMEERQYTCHKVFGPDIDQGQLFDCVVLPLMERFVNGESCVLFAYGITNAGKTHTIQGSVKESGILPRLVSGLVERTSDSGSSDLQLGMCEIYQEKIFDLLSKRAKLTIRDRGGQAELPDLSYHAVDSAEKTLKLVAKGSAKRSSGRTLLNSGSSRSHAVYSLTLRGEVFQIVDLAGAERNNRTKASGNQQKEANHINMSLMSLWRCLNAVKKKSRESQEMVPYRESKLTHYLFPLFSRVGANGISMIACVSPDPQDYDESLSVLENASLACEIKKIAPVRVAPPVTHRSSTLALAEGKSAGVVDKPRVVSRKRDASAMTRQSSNTTVGDVSVVTNGSDQLAKTLQARLDALEAENEQLQQYQFEREHEIRLEVCNEMAERSAMLLEQIKDLQDELYEHKHDRIDHTKSVKKMRNIQRMASQATITMELQQSEEEMETMKLAYEKEIKSLKFEMRSLKAEASDWKKKAEEAMKIVASLKESAGVKAIDTGNIENEVTAAECFDLRMQRDQRFNKHKKLAELSPKLRNQKNIKDRPREPLSPKSSNIANEELQSADAYEVPLCKSRRSSDALPIAPPMSPGIKGSGPFYPKAKRTLRSQIRA